MAPPLRALLGFLALGAVQGLNGGLNAGLGGELAMEGHHHHREAASHAHDGLHEATHHENHPEAEVYYEEEAAEVHPEAWTHVADHHEHHKSDGTHSNHVGYTHRHGFEAPHNHVTKPDEKVAMETAELAQSPDDAEYDCHMACDMIDEPIEKDNCHQDCDYVAEEEESVMECLMRDCEAEFGECMMDEECGHIAMDEQKRMDCVTGGFEGCAEPLFATAFACYMDHCFKEEHIPHLHHDDATTEADLHAMKHDDHEFDHHHHEHAGGLSEPHHEPPHYHNAQEEEIVEIVETAEFNEEDPVKACHELCEMDTVVDDKEMCHADCDFIEEEHDNEPEDVYICLFTNCGEEFGACMGNHECAVVAEDDMKRMDCVSNEFKDCPAEFKPAFGCYLDNCFHESHLPYIHHDEDMTHEDLHKMTNGGYKAEYDHAADYYDYYEADEVYAAVATAEMDQEDPEKACEMACDMIENDHDREMCFADCHGVEEDAEEEDVWGCLMDHCEEPVNKCIHDPACAETAMDEQKRMHCVTEKFDGCPRDFQPAFACYMSHCFHPTHIPYLHHDSEISEEDLHEIAHTDYGYKAESAEHRDSYESKEHHSQSYESSEHHDSYESKDHHSQSYESSEHHDHHEECSVFEGGEDATCDPKVWYCNGDCWMDCPDGYEHHDEKCIQSECGPGQHMTMNWDTDTPYCVEAEPAGILEKEFSKGWFRHEEWGDDPEHGCTEAPADGSCDPSTPVWWCNGWCEAEQCWERGEGWHNLWLPVEESEHGHWESFCVMYEECGEGRAQLHSWHGKQLCSHNWHEEECDGTWSHIFSEERGHHVRVCVKGQKGEFKRPQTTFERWEDEGEDPVMKCIDEFCPVIWSCAEDPECGVYLNEDDAHKCLSEDCSAYPGIFKDSVECYFEHCHEIEEKEHEERKESGEDETWTCLKENCPGDVESCFNDPLCAKVIQDDHARDSCINAGFPIEECTEFLQPVFECYMTACA